MLNSHTKTSNMADAGDRRNDGFNCGVCFELMVQPTTLNCGHSFCRHCLAHWFTQSKQAVCPVCRKGYDNLPHVSFVLRTVIEDSSPTAYAERQRAVLNPENTHAVERLEQAFSANSVLSRGRQATAALRDRKQQLLGLAIISTAAIILWTLFCWLLGIRSVAPPPPRLVSKWSSTETLRWLGDVAPWAAASELEGAFQQLHIDGAMLMALTEKDVHDLAPSLSELQVRALLAARDDEAGHTLGAPADFWEYKTRHVHKTVWLVELVYFFPRSTLLLLYLFDYEDTFLPLLHSTSPTENLTGVSLYSTRFPSPSAVQWIEFCFRALLYPYLGVFANFTLGRLWGTNWVVSLYSSTVLLCLTVVDARQAFQLYRNMRSTNRQLLQQALCSLFNTLALFTVTWWLQSLVPNILLHALFYIRVCSAAEKFQQASNIVAEVLGRAQR